MLIHVLRMYANVGRLTNTRICNRTKRHGIEELITLTIFTSGNDPPLFPIQINSLWLLPTL